MTSPETHTTRRLLLGVFAAVVSGAMAAAATPAAAAPAVGDIRLAGTSNAVAGSYIVVLKDSAVGAKVGTAQAITAIPTRAAELTKRYGGSVQHVYGAALNGFSVNISDAAARRLAANPAVAYVEQDQRVWSLATQTNPPSWGLDRIDQRSRPLNSAYTYPVTASNVRAYILDTGIRTSHNDFGGRATWGTNTSGDGNNTDCNGHGTHVAGTVGGTAHGVAKAVRLVAVKVLTCSGSGTNAGVIAGVNWVTNNAVKPAVANMSLGGGANSSLDTAVNNSINSGITYAIAAGNSGANACNYSPARVAAAITVGSTTSTDARSSFSNTGSCVDIYAPGSSIRSAWHTSNTATNSISGTSMAAPHVAGAAALVLSVNTGWSPTQVRNHLVNNGTTISTSVPRLLYVF